MLDLSVNYRNKPRTFWTTAFVRAEDLRDGDVVKIDGAWRWIYGIDEEGIEDSSLFESIKKRRDDLPETVVIIRFARDDKSTGGDYEDEIIVRPTTDLIEIQVPVDHPPLNLSAPKEA